jgi:hypothetical protein
VIRGLFSNAHTFRGLRSRFMGRLNPEGPLGAPQWRAHGQQVNGQSVTSFNYSRFAERFRGQTL